MTGELVAGVDVATANVRVQVHDPAGALLAQSSRPLPAPVRSDGGRSEQDARSWWPAVRDCLADCTADLGWRSGGITALAISATSGTVVAVDARGEPVGPALMYDDRRARVSWLAENLPAGAEQICHTPEVLGHRLVGHPVATDTSHALKSGYDPVAGAWAAQAPSGLLPQVVRPTTALGQVGREASVLTGLPVGCEVRAGMTDGCAGQLATGAVDPGRFVTVMGTTLVLKGVSEKLVHDPDGVVYSHLHPEGRWLPGGAANIGGSALSDVDPAELPELDSAALAQGPASALNYPLRGKGERFPFRAPDAEEFLVGAPRDRVDEHRSRLEGIAFCERLALERLATLGAVAEGPVRTAGGGARSTPWCQIRATVLGRPVLRVMGAGTALGAALLAATGSVHPDLSTAAAAMVPAGERVEPNPAELEELGSAYERFTEQLRHRGWL
ncbi:carbohydrate kinase [Saccharopolyspora rhizosphaerae]|uniref:Carbohydrate kinase n=1 Tax=Saccharopolyspora rhizosphaerae TaxID=2492662 RepID=A0A3R8Q4B3_9PSEU|nr:FGGY-family carbohydrate kinase [Saccharopolyspora rhizosphaerae]RRO12784.1 carbohydrate kinase [Saccharopolyspora rhizosphaerae]